MFTKKILAKDVKQGQLFVFSDCGKPNMGLGTFRRVFLNGYITTMGDGLQIMGTSDMSLLMCHQENSVFVQE